MHKAIGTSSALAWSLALAGGLGYLISGYSVADLPRTNLGYIHIQALLCIAFTSMLIAPLGVKLSHALPVQILKKNLCAALICIRNAHAYHGLVLTSNSVH